MTHLHIDAPNGIAGDMLLSALIDAGADIEVISCELKKLHLEGFDLSTEEVLKSGVRAKHLVITEHNKEKHSHNHEHHHHKHGHHHSEGPARSLPDIVKLLDSSHLSDKTKEKALGIFRLIAEAEGKIHNKPADKIHFHEISGLDTIIDIVGCVVALELLDVESVTCSKVSVGSGFVNCAHGKMALPAPATAEILKGKPLRQLDTNTEICTPTGAALSAGLSDSFGPCPEMSIKKIGYGAGSKDIPGHANVLRVFIGKKSGSECNTESDTICQFTCAIDDMTGEKLSYALENILKAGAIDAYFKPVIMKKSRPGFELVVLAKPESKENITETIFKNTRTFGLRTENIDRKILSRKIIDVDVSGEKVRVKAGFLSGKPITFSAEYEDCRTVSEKLNMSIEEIFSIAENTARKTCLS